MIELRDITVRFGSHTVLERFHADIPLEGVTAVTGPSGSGKTTLLRLLLGLQRPDAGTIRGLTGLRVAPVFQEDRLLPWRTALENAALTGDRDAAADYLRRLGLSDALHVKPAALSGGMRRRVAMARALNYRGDLLLLDEPFTGLDEEARRKAAGVLLDTGLPMVVVTHDPEKLTLLGAARRIAVPSLAAPAAPDSPVPAG